MSTESITETAVILVNPYIDQGVIAFQEQALKLRTYATETCIDNDTDVKVATNDLSTISKLKKALEEKRKEYTAPINEHLKSINDAFKTVVTPLEQADQITRKKILDYRAAMQKKADEIAEINRLREEAAQREAKLNGTGEISEPVNIIETPTAPATTIRADVGTLSTMKIWKWSVEDITKVPSEYLIVDGARLTRVVKAGVRDIPGIRIYSEDTLTVRAK
jgi:hypothetical protein